MINVPPSMHNVAILNNVVLDLVLNNLLDVENASRKKFLKELESCASTDSKEI